MVGGVAADLDDQAVRHGVCGAGQSEDRVLAQGKELGVGNSGEPVGVAQCRSGKEFACPCLVHDRLPVIVSYRPSLAFTEVVLTNGRTVSTMTEAVRHYWTKGSKQ